MAPPSADLGVQPLVCVKLRANIAFLSFKIVHVCGGVVGKQDVALDFFFARSL